MKNLNKNIETALTEDYGTNYYGLDLKVKNETENHITLIGSLIHELGKCKINIYQNKNTGEVEVFEF